MAQYLLPIVFPNPPGRPPPPLNLVRGEGFVQNLFGIWSGIVQDLYGISFKSLMDMFRDCLGLVWYLIKLYRDLSGFVFDMFRICSELVPYIQRIFIQNMFRSFSRFFY